MNLSRLRLAASVLAALISVVTIVQGDAPLIEVEGTFIEAAGDGWTIGNALIRYSISHNGKGASVGGIEQPESGHDWNRGTTSDTFIRINGQLVNVGSTQMAFLGTDAIEWSGGVRLALRYRLNDLEITRFYACYPGSSVIETWTTFHQLGAEPVTLSDLTSFALSIQNGTLNWITGLQYAQDSGTPFDRLYGDLDEGQTFDLGSDRRASEQALPWFSVRADGEEFFGSILWSGSWHFRIQRHGETAKVQLGLPTFDTSLAGGASLETPHAIFGLTGRTVPDTSMALRGFIDRAVRHGRPLNAYVTYNTWYSKGTFLDEPSMLAEMELAAGIGVEQFVIDAGWWQGANQSESGDFVSNWGNWTVDADRFPSGLGYLSDRAHELGMRFGVWVEPERVDRLTVGRPGMAAERFLATSDGRYDPGAVGPGRRRAQPRNPIAPGTPIRLNDQSVSAQVCLVDSEARAWVVDKLVSFIEETRPDYLKWDNNLWVNCSRAGHGHGADDANFLHHRALQSVLDLLRDRFPDMDIENCASGGNRLSLDMLARTDSAWMDDRTENSARMRHEVQGLMALLPPPYLLSFATTVQEAVDEEHIGEGAYVLRSRMLGMPGVSWTLATMDEGTLSDAARQIALYKRLRPFQAYGSAILLSAQVQPKDPFNWDAVEFLVPGGGEAALVAFNSFGAAPFALVKMRGLRPDAVYEVESADAGPLGEVTGRDLMDLGIELQKADAALGHVIFLRAQ